MADDQDKKNDQKQDDQNRSNANASDKGDQQRDRTVPYARFTEINEKRKAAEDELAAVADSLKEDIPEDHRDLIPDLPPAALIKWIRAANAKGIFSPKAVESPDGGRRPNPRQPTEDTTGLSPQTIMARGYTAKK
jgi:hypothetical protein